MQVGLEAIKSGSLALCDPPRDRPNAAQDQNNVTLDFCAITIKHRGTKHRQLNSHLRGFHNINLRSATYLYVELFNSQVTINLARSSR